MADTVDNQETKDRWTEYCRELYERTEDYDSTVMIELEEIAPPVAESRDELLRFEVEKTVKKLKPNSQSTWYRWHYRRDFASWRGRCGRGAV